MALARAGFAGWQLFLALFALAAAFTLGARACRPSPRDSAADSLRAENAALRRDSITLAAIAARVDSLWERDTGRLTGAIGAAHGERHVTDAQLRALLARLRVSVPDSLADSIAAVVAERLAAERRSQDSVEQACRDVQRTCDSRVAAERNRTANAEDRARNAEARVAVERRRAEPARFGATVDGWWDWGASRPAVRLTPDVHFGREVYGYAGAQLAPADSGRYRGSLVTGARARVRF